MSLRLELVDVHAEIEGKEILKGVSLTVEQGRFHALMGPNGSGKTTLSRVIMGDRRYRITKGSILLDGEDITNLPTHERARKGLFLTFQNPVELPGVKLFTLIRSSYLVHHPDDKRSFQEFITYVQSKARLRGMDTSLLSRGVNEGFSGGERKKSEILQMSLIKPRIAIIDEIDSGLDVDAVKIIGSTISNAAKENGIGVIVITHYTRILNSIEFSNAANNSIHILSKGRFVKEGGKELASAIEEKGYSAIVGE